VNVNRAVNKNVIKTIEEHQIQPASFLRELLLLRHNYLVFSNNGGFNRVELDSVIHVICTD
jgi:hypothetical protein